MPTGILAIHYHLPEGILTHAELVERFGERMDAVAESAGIYERRIAAQGETASDLAFVAADELLRTHNIDRGTIDYLIFCTQTPDYLIPTTACILQERLGLPKSVGAIDLNQGCSQFVYGLQVAAGLIASGSASKVLVLTGDTDTKIIHPQDRANVPIFGDCGTATLVGEVEDGAGFMGFEVGTDGAGHKLLIQPASGLRLQRSEHTKAATTDADGSVRTEEHLFMDGRSIFIFGLSVVPKLIDRLVARVGVAKADIDLFVLHQANRYMIESILKRAGIPMHKTHMALKRSGNSGGSTVALALSEAWSAGRIQPGNLVALVAFGVGLSWAGTVIRWPGSTIGPVNSTPQLDG